MTAHPAMEKRHARELQEKVQLTQHYAWQAADEQRAIQLTRSPGAEEANYSACSTCDTSSTSAVSSSLSSFSGDSVQDSDSDGSAKDENCSPLGTEKMIMSQKWQLFPISEGASLESPAADRVLEESTYAVTENAYMEINRKSPPVDSKFSQPSSTELVKKLGMKVPAERSNTYKSQYMRDNLVQEPEETEAESFFEEMFQLLESGISKTSTNQKKKKLEGTSPKEDFATSTCDVHSARVEEKSKAEVGKLEATDAIQDPTAFHAGELGANPASATNALLNTMHPSLAQRTVYTPFAAFGAADGGDRSLGTGRGVSDLESAPLDVTVRAKPDFATCASHAEQDVAICASRDHRQTKNRSIDHNQDVDSETPSYDKIMSDIGFCLKSTEENELDIDKLKDVHSILSQVQVAVDALQGDSRTFAKLEEEFAKSMRSADSCARSAPMAAASKAATVEPATDCNNDMRTKLATKIATVEPATDDDKDMWTKLEKEFEKYMQSADARFKSQSTTASSSTATVGTESTTAATVEPSSSIAAPVELETKPVATSKRMALPCSSPVVASRPRALSPGCASPSLRMARSLSPVAVSRSLSLPVCPSTTPSHVVRQPVLSAVPPPRAQSVSGLARSVAPVAPAAVSSVQQPCPTLDHSSTTAVSRLFSVTHPGSASVVTKVGPSRLANGRIMLGT